MTFASQLDPSVKAMQWSTDGKGAVLAYMRSGAPNLWLFPWVEGEAKDGGMKYAGHGQPKALTFYKSGMIWDFKWSKDGKQVAIAHGSNASDVVVFREQR